MVNESPDTTKNETFTWLQPGTWRKPCIVHVTMVANSRQTLFGKLTHNGNEANPERAWQRRQNPDLFRMHRKTEVCGLQFTSMGNHFLLDWPDRQLVEISRSATDEQIGERLKSVLAAAHNGAVTYTAAISDGERMIARTVREQGYPIVVLLNRGFPIEGSPQERYYKPGGTYFNACSKGRLLLLEPEECDFINPSVRAATEDTLRRKAEAKHYNYTDVPVESQRYRFVALNEIGRTLVSQ